MACYHPVPAFQSGPGSRVVLHPKGVGLSPSLATLKLPCGSCLGCYAARACEWANRCSHEAAFWQHNSFVTLTYDDANLPWDGGLEPWELAKFLKRLRKYATTCSSVILMDSSSGIRFFASGEYGEHRLRPHYHVLLFNCGFADALFVGSSNGHDLFCSDVLSKLWRFGSHKLGTVTGASANYTAQYSMKKYGSVPSGNLEPPFIRMSLKPAIGSRYACRFGGDFVHGYMVVNGHKVKVPRAYFRYLDPAFGEAVKFEASKRGCFREDLLPDRLADAERIHESKNRVGRSGRLTF